MPQPVVGLIQEEFTIKLMYCDHTFLPSLDCLLKIYHACNDLFSITCLAFQTAYMRKK